MNECIQKRVELLKSQLVVTQSSDQSHISHRFYLPAGMDALEITFDYSPKLVALGEDNRTQVLQAFDFYNDRLIKNSKIMDGFSTFKNLLTVSIEDPIGFRGNCHRFTEQQETIHVGKEGSTPGVLNREMQSGMWTITISCHCIISEKCHIQLAVHGIQSNAHSKRWFNKPFEQVEKMTVKNSLEENVTSSKQNTYDWKKSEIHSHTNHSDGSQSIEELVNKARELDISYLAVTDHNTMSATENIAELEKAYGVRLIRGIEWTTFYGHMLTLGYDHLTAINWSRVGPNSIEESIKEVKKEGAIVGIAHPYQIGSPFCTGCYWEYDMSDLNHYDFLEVWNGEDPHRSKINKLAFDKWTELLNHGAKIGATYGRDWHQTETTKQVAALYLYLPEQATLYDIKRAIKNGHSYISMGPRINMYANEHCISGDTISLSEKRSMMLDFEITEYNDSYTIVLDSNIGAIYRHECTGAINKKIKVEKTFGRQHLTWLRLLIYSSRKELIAFTNPIYIEV